MRLGLGLGAAEQPTSSGGSVGSVIVDTLNYNAAYGDVGVLQEPYTLEGWKLTLPWDVNELYVGGADEILQPDLLTYSSIWFTRGSGVFDYTCPEGGSTTATATYARCELRHLTNYAWNSNTEMKLVWSDVDIPDGEKVIVFQTHDSDAPEFKMTYTGAGASNSDGLFRILYKATEGAGDTTVVIDNTISRGDLISIRIRRTPSELQIFYGANVDGTTPDWSSNDDTAFSRDGTNGTYYWKQGNYLQIDNPPYTDSPAYTIRHHEGTWSNPATFAVDSVSVSTMAFDTTYGSVGLPDLGSSTPVLEASTQVTDSDSDFTGASAVVVPTGTTDGDQLLMIVSQDNAPASNPFTTPTGWTIERAWTQTTGIGQIVYKRVASSEPANYTVACSNTNVGNAVMLRISGVNATPVDIETSTASSGDPAVAPTATTTVDNTLVLRIASWDASKTLTLAPSGVTEAQHVDTSGHDLWVGSEEQVTAGATGTAEWDLSSSTAWVCSTIAIAPT